MRFLSVEGVTGQEAASPRPSTRRCRRSACRRPRSASTTRNKRIPLPTETGNLIVDLPGTRAGPRLLFSTHLDTVPLCAGAKPSREGDRIVSDGTTALGGDNRTGVRAARRARRDADQAQAAASADHAAVHGARGERPARRPRTQSGRPRRRRHVLQRRRPARRGSDHRRGRPGELGGRDQRARPRTRASRPRRASRRRWSAPSLSRRPARRAGSARS